MQAGFQASVIIVFAIASHFLHCLFLLFTIMEDAFLSFKRETERERDREDARHCHAAPP